MENLSQFEQFLMLDDIKEGSKMYNEAQSELQRLQAERETEYSEPDFDEPESQEYEYDFDDTDFKSMFEDGDLKFEDEEGYTNRATNPNRKEEDEEQDDDNFLQEDEEGDSEDFVEDADQYDEQGAENEAPGETLNVDYDDYITLPDGRSMTIEDLSKAYVSSEERAMYNQEIEQRLQQVELREKAANDVLTVAQLEVDQRLAYYNNLDWANLRAVDVHSYADHMDDFEQAKRQKQQLIEAVRIREAQQREEQEQAKVAKAKAAIAMLKQEIPEWNEPLYQRAMDHAINRMGFDEADVVSELRVPAIRSWVKDMQRYEIAQKQKTQIVRKSAPKFARAGAPAKSTEPDHSKLAKAFASGKLSSADAFKYLVD